MTRNPFFSEAVILGVWALPLLLVGCGDVARTGRAPAFVIVDRVEGASGARPSEFGSSLFSDVETLVTQQINGQAVRVPTKYSDGGRVTFRLALTNPGTPANPTSPSTLNDVTFTRYRVTFRRADGRNAPGVDVPYGFDAALTVTVAGGSTSQVGFELVRLQMKQEPPLRNLAGGGGANMISTIAEIAFYGRDQTGNEVSAIATLSVNFGDFGDPE